MSTRRARTRAATRDETAGFVIGPERRVSADEPQGSVYVLLDRVFCQVKIGFTARSVRTRQRAHESKWGRSLELLGVMRGGRSLERALHRRFADYRTGPHREWFRSEIAAELLPLLDEEASGGVC